MLSICSGASQPLLLLSAAVALCPPADPRTSRLAWLMRHRASAVDRESIDVGSGVAGRSIAGPIGVPAGGSITRQQRSSRPRAIAMATGVSLLGALAVFGHQVVASAFLIIVMAALLRLARSLAAQRLDDGNRSDLVSAVAALRDEYSAGVEESAALRAAAGSAGRYRTDFIEAATAVGCGSAADVRFGNPALARLDAACAVSASTGNRLGPVLSAVGQDLQRDEAVRRDVRSALAAPQSSALLLAALPLIGVGLGSAMGVSPLRILLHTGWGATALAVGTTLDVAGLAWTMAMARRVLP